MLCGKVSAPFVLLVVPRLFTSTHDRRPHAAAARVFIQSASVATFASGHASPCSGAAGAAAPRCRARADCALLHVRHVAATARLGAQRRAALRPGSAARSTCTAPTAHRYSTSTITAPSTYLFSTSTSPFTTSATIRTVLCTLMHAHCHCGSPTARARLLHCGAISHRRHHWTQH
jgi:hypothetical protein